MGGKVHRLDTAQFGDRAAKRSLDAARELERCNEPARAGAGEPHPDLSDAILNANHLKVSAGALEVKLIVCVPIGVTLFDAPDAEP